MPLPAMKNQTFSIRGDGCKIVCVTRVVAGLAKGRHLEVPETGTRPTSDRVREALFSSLEHHVGSFASLDILDLFAGSGALGLEALSRGAQRVVLVEKDRRAIEIIKRNITKMNIPGALVINDDVKRLVAAAPTRGTFDVVFMDPPYAMPDDEVQGIVGALVQQGWLNSHALLVVERSKGSSLDWPTDWESLSKRDYGGTQLHTGVWYGPDRA